MTSIERRDYIDALFCLRSVPSILPNSQYPGVQDRFDDFVAYVPSSCLPCIDPLTNGQNTHQLHLAHPQQRPLPPLAPSLPAPLREHPPHRMRLQRHHPLLELAPSPQPHRLPPLRQLPRLTLRRRHLHPRRTHPLRRAGRLHRPRHRWRLRNSRTLHLPLLESKHGPTEPPRPGRAVPPA